MLNRKIGFIAAALFLMAMPVVAFATTARLEGMNVPNDYSNDFSAIYGWPSAITGVGNLVYAELGSSDRAMGAVLPNLWNGKYGTWAVHLRDYTPYLGQGSSNVSGNPGNWGWDPNWNSNQAFDIMWGKKFGTNSLGIQLNRSFNGVKDEVPGTTWLFNSDYYYPGLGTYGNFDRNLLGMSVGYGFEINPNTSAEVSLLWQSRTFENSETPGDKYSDNGGSNYMFGLRASHKCTPGMTVVPVAKYYSYDLSTKSVVGTVSTTKTNTIKGWQLGAAGNWTIGSNDLFVLGATLAQNTLDQEAYLYGLPSEQNYWDESKKTKLTETLMPQIFMALETQVNPWLALRMGATKGAFHTVKVEGTVGTDNSYAGMAETVTYKNSPFSMNAGASIKLGSLTFDTMLDYYFFQNPFAQLIGSQNAYFDGSEVFPKVSASYRW